MRQLWFQKNENQERFLLEELRLELLLDLDLPRSSPATIAARSAASRFSSEARLKTYPLLLLLLRPELAPSALRARDA